MDVPCPRWRALLGAAILSWLAAAAAADESSLATGVSATIAARGDDDAPSRGPALAPVTLELACPYGNTLCDRIDAKVTALAGRHPERLRVVYRMVDGGGRDGPRLAEAALEAWAQGRFLPFHDRLRRPGGTAGAADLARVAVEAGLDLGALDAALADGRHRARLLRDTAHMAQLGAPRGPALVMNGTPLTVVGMRDDLLLDALESAYDAAYAAARARLEDGLPLESLYPTLLREQRRARVAQALEGDAGGAGAVSLDTRVPVPIAGAPTRGARSPEVVIVWFGDYECPFCRQLAPQIQSLLAEHPDDVLLVFRQFPLSIHPGARLDAEAAMCAAAQGRFWALHDAMYASPGRRLRPSELARLAATAGLDVARFLADLDGGRCAAAVDADIALGEQLGVEATPTLFVDGIKLDGMPRPGVLQALVEAELEPGGLARLTGP